MTLYPQLIMDALATVTYAGTKKNLVDSGMVADTPSVAAPATKGEPWKVKVVLEFPRDTDPFLKSTVKAAEAAIKYYCRKESGDRSQESGDGSQESEEVSVEIITEFKSAPRPEVEKLLPGVKNIIAVSSGKGGVGKSTVSANLAIALARLGYRVGLLDTDIFGPSMPKMFNVEDERPYAVKKDGRDLICPIEKYGVKLLSIGFFVSPTTATLWRGGMATSALKQLIADADWGELDYFILDTPPGTSDIHLTLLQTLPITGAVIVSTPQQVALADARKGIDMYRNEKVNVPILGLIENMAWFTPAELPGNRYYIFGKEGCKHLAEEMNVPLLAQIPLVQSICDNGDAGTPAALSSDTATGLAFINLAQAVVTVVNRRNKEQPKTKIVGMK
ncbi:MAG: Mrp/NBP35 family ATP-binding protein [Prevotella sp.]|nr:Mrp/NBP35 family ATP-binding protein [Prevotella sp.]